MSDITKVLKLIRCPITLMWENISDEGISRFDASV